MEKVTGIGGVFIKAEDPDGIYDWYERHLGIRCDANGAVCFQWRHADDSEQNGFTVWSSSPSDPTYFNPSRSPFMVNFRVADLDSLLNALHEEGVSVVPKPEESESGRFAWVMDPEGNRIELWEPPEER